MLPVDKGLLSMVVRHLPAPHEAQGERIQVFCPELDTPKHSLLRENVALCKKEGPLIVYISKMMPVNAKIY